MAVEYRKAKEQQQQQHVCRARPSVIQRAPLLFLFRWSTAITVQSQHKT